MTEAVTGKLPEIGFPKERIQLLEKQYINDITKTVVLTGGRAYRSFLRRGRKQLPERFEGLGHTLEGGNFAEWMKRSDGAANNFVRNLYDTTVSGKAIELAMENPAQADHGIPHLRRVEEWFEQAIFNDKEIRHSKLPFKFWLPAAYLAIRNHDVIQLLNGKKPYHAELAALFTLASYKQVSKAFDVSREQAFAYCQFAAMMILQHTSVPVTSATSAKAIFEELGPIFDKFMPEVIKQEFKSEFDLLKKDDRPLTKNFADNGDTQASHKVFKKYSDIFSVADKFDTLYPAELAALRSLMASPAKGREFYVQPETLKGFEQVSLEEELNTYAKSKEFHDEEVLWDRSDIGRKLHEFKKEFVKTDNQYFIETMNNNKLAAIKKLKRLYTRLMAKDTQAISEIFLERREHIKTKVADRVKNVRLKKAREEMEKYGQAVPALRLQREELMAAIKPKIRDYSQAEIDRVAALFDLLFEQELKRQGISADEAEGIEEVTPYGYYDSIAVLKDMRCNTLVSGKRIR